MRDKMRIPGEQEPEEVAAEICGAVDALRTELEAARELAGKRADDYERMVDCAVDAEMERDALRTENTALRDALREMCDLGRHQVCHYQEDSLTPPSGCGKCSACKIRIASIKFDPETLEAQDD